MSGGSSDLILILRGPTHTQLESTKRETHTEEAEMEFGAVQTRNWSLANKHYQTIVWWPNILLLYWVPNRIKHVWSPSKRNRMSYNVWSIVCPLSKFYQTRLNTLKQGVQTGECFVAKQYLIMFLCQSCIFSAFGQDFRCPYDVTHQC